MNSFISDSETEYELHDNGIVQPIYWSEDNTGNINFDIESIREEFERLISLMEEHNEKSDFDWDNI